MRCCRVPEGCGRYEKNTPIANVQCPSTLNPLDPGESVTCMESLIVNDAQTTAIGGELSNEGSSFDGDGAQSFAVSLDKNAIKTALGDDSMTTADGYCKFELTYAAKVNAAAG